jgi:hypothetical protein
VLSRQLLGCSAPSVLRRSTPSCLTHHFCAAPPLLCPLPAQAVSWHPDTLSLMLPGSLEEGLRTGQPQFFPRLGGIMQLLSRRATAASAWVHLLTINAFAARHAYLDGTRRRLPVAHSLALALLAGPLGLASHLVTKAAVRHLRRRRMAARRRARAQC